MAAGNEGGNLLWVLAELCAELGLDPGVPVPGEARLARSSMPRCAGEKEELLIASLREALARLGLAANVAGRNEEEPSFRTALDGAELVMRAEIAAGHAAELDSYLPAFILMVALPGIGRERAVELSQRAERLLAEKSRSQS